MQPKGESISEAERLKIYIKSLDEKYENSTLSFLERICECPNQPAAEPRGPAR